MNFDILLLLFSSIWQSWPVIIKPYRISLHWENEGERGGDHRISYCHWKYFHKEIARRDENSLCVFISLPNPNVSLCLRENRMLFPEGISLKEVNGRTTDICTDDAKLKVVCLYDEWECERVKEKDTEHKSFSYLVRITCHESLWRGVILRFLHLIEIFLM